jgi:hypothetical protein
MVKGLEIKNLPEGPLVGCRESFKLHVDAGAQGFPAAAGL